MLRTTIILTALLATGSVLAADAPQKQAAKPQQVAKADKAARGGGERCQDVGGYLDPGQPGSAEVAGDRAVEGLADRRHAGTVASAR